MNHAHQEIARVGADMNASVCFWLLKQFKRILDLAQSLHCDCQIFFETANFYMIGFKTSYQKNCLVDTALLGDCKQTK